MAAKFPTAPDNDRLKVVAKEVENDAIGSIAQSISASGTANVSFATDGYRNINLYGGIDVGQSINTGSGSGIYVYVENSPDNTNWYYYKELYINSGMNYENNIANIEVVIAPYMRVVVKNDDSSSYQVNVYVHGIKSRD